MENRHRPKTREGFRIAILCALPREASAVRALFDEEWEGAASSYGKGPNDHNAYSFGWLGEKPVVLAYASMGKIAAANASKDLKASFRNIGLLLVVGVCGGAPRDVENGTNIHLGDVAVSTQVIQDDFGRRYDDRFIRKAEAEFALTRASPEIRNFLAKLAATKERMVERTNDHLIEALQHPETCSLHPYPGIDQDKLFRSDYRHKHREKNKSPSSSDECPQICSICTDCVTSQDAVCEDALKATCSQLGCAADGYQMRSTPRRVSVMPAVSPQKEVRHVNLHFGRIISTDSVVKSASYRDEAISREGVIAFEMESAGAWENAPTILVKGVVDYADSHKNKDWQGFAALSAAACAKTIVEEWALGSEAHEVIPGRDIPSNTLHTTAMYRDLLTALDPVDPDASLMDAKARTRAGFATEGTCQWLFGSKDFRDWSAASHDSLLVLSGEPGIGKTTMATVIVDRLRERERTTDSTVAYFFCDNKLEQRRTVLSILRSLLYQILNRFPRLCEPIQQKFDVFHHKLFKDFSSIWPWFERTLSAYSLGEVCIVIDALDECEQTGRVELIRVLCSLLGRHRFGGPNQDRLKLLVLTRPILITELLGNQPEQEWHITLNRKLIKHDLEIYVEKEVEALVQRRRWSQGTHGAIQSELKSRHDGTFLWVALVVKNIAQPKVREHEVLEVLRRFPSGLTDVYIRILREIDEVEHEHAPYVFQYVLASGAAFLESTDIEASVLLHFRHKAEPGSRPLPSLEKIKRLRSAVDACGLLLRSDQTWGLEFLHQSVKDFLTGQDLPSGLLHYRINEKKASAAYHTALRGYLEATEFEQLATLDRRILKAIARSDDEAVRRQIEAVSSRSFEHLTQVHLEPLTAAVENFRWVRSTESPAIVRIIDLPQLPALLKAAVEQGQTAMVRIHLLISPQSMSLSRLDSCAIVASMFIESLGHGHAQVTQPLLDEWMLLAFGRLITETMARMPDDENAVEAYITLLKKHRANVAEHGIDHTQLIRMAVFAASSPLVKQLIDARRQKDALMAKALHVLSGYEWLVFRCRGPESDWLEELVLELDGPARDCLASEWPFESRNLTGDEARRFCELLRPSKCSLMIEYTAKPDETRLSFSMTGTEWVSNRLQDHDYWFGPQSEDSFSINYWTPLEYAMDLWRTCRDERRREVAHYLAEQMKDAQLLSDNDYKAIVEEFEAAKDNTVVDMGLDRYTTDPFEAEAFRPYQNSLPWRDKLISRTRKAMKRVFSKDKAY